jgi:hypothetical protein
MTTKDTGQAFKFGQTALSTKENGVSTKPMEVESSGTQMETFTKDNGRTTKQMAMVSMSMLTEQSTKVTGRTISKMETVLRVGQMDRNIKAATRKE